MEVLADAMAVIILQQIYINVSNQCMAHFKPEQCYMSVIIIKKKERKTYVNYNSILKRKGKHTYTIPGHLVILF